MLSSICSFLTGKLALRHPTLKVLVREDGAVLGRRGWTYGCLDKQGYKVIGISKKNYSIHRLVAETFLPNPDNKPTVDHINRCRDDNRASNLRWATHHEQRMNSSQVLDAVDYGVKPNEDPKEYHRIIARKNYWQKRQDPEWVKRERERLREYDHRMRNDPEYRARQAIKRKRYLDKKKEGSGRSPHEGSVELV